MRLCSDAELQRIEIRALSRTMSCFVVSRTAGVRAQNNRFARVANNPSLLVQNQKKEKPSWATETRASREPNQANTTHSYTRHNQSALADAAVPELPVSRRFRDASRTPRSSTTNGAAPTALTELFASAADRFPDESLESISRSSQAWDQASPKAGPGLSELKFDAS